MIGGTLERYTEEKLKNLLLTQTLTEANKLNETCAARESSSTSSNSIKLSESPSSTSSSSSFSIQSTSIHSSPISAATTSAPAPPPPPPPPPLPPFLPPLISFVSSKIKSLDDESYENSKSSLSDDTTTNSSTMNSSNIISIASNHQNNTGVGSSSSYSSSNDNNSASNINSSQTTPTGSANINFACLNNGNSSSNEVIYLNSNELNNKLPQQCVPKPSMKMKSLIWSKIHPNRIIGKQSLWTKFKSQYEQNGLLDYDTDCTSVESLNYFQEIEEFFKTSENPRAESQCKEPNLRETKLWNSSEKINLLDSKRSLNINIYLKQFRW
jgi:hypothetical protein